MNVNGNDAAQKEETEAERVTRTQREHDAEVAKANAEKKKSKSWAVFNNVTQHIEAAGFRLEEDAVDHIRLLLGAGAVADELVPVEVPGAYDVPEKKDKDAPST